MNPKIKNDDNTTEKNDKKKVLISVNNSYNNVSKIFQEYKLLCPDPCLVFVFGHTNLIYVL